MQVEINQSSKCPCGSLKDLGKCCYPIINEELKAPSAEALMRARYTAYVINQIDFIEKTQSKGGEAFDREQAQAWAKESDWAGLEIINTVDNFPTVDQAQVEFKANYSIQGQEFTHHEVSTFLKDQGDWFFEEGKIINAPLKRIGPKIGRNDPCHCGSGKKFKKCCG